jgi:hypothetical protein
VGYRGFQVTRVGPRIGGRLTAAPVGLCSCKTFTSNIKSVAVTCWRSPKVDPVDNQVRAAIAAALGDFKGDEGAFSTETKLLQSDPSYAIHAATAIGASGSPLGTTASASPA